MHKGTTHFAEKMNMLDFSGKSLGGIVVGYDLNVVSSSMSISVLK